MFYDELPSSHRLAISKPSTYHTLVTSLFEYSILLSFFQGWCIATAAATLTATATATTGCSAATQLSRYLICTSSTVLVSLYILSFLRHRNESLQYTTVLIKKLLLVAAVLLLSLTSVATTCVLIYYIAEYTTLYNSNASISESSCPSLMSTLYVTSVMASVMNIPVAVYHICSAIYIIYIRLVFLAPPRGQFDNEDDLKRIVYVRTVYGDVIPTILMLPTTTNADEWHENNRQQRQQAATAVNDHGATAIDVVQKNEEKASFLLNDILPKSEQTPKTGATSAINTTDNSPVILYSHGNAMVCTCTE
jgi:hypothetical protein